MSKGHSFFPVEKFALIRKSKYGQRFCSGLRHTSEAEIRKREGVQIEYRSLTSKPRPLGHKEMSPFKNPIDFLKIT